MLLKKFSYKQFTNLEELIKLKSQTGLSIGLALPVRNEEKTIRSVITKAKKCGGLLDEIIVVDSGSTDKSVDYCKKMGIPFYLDRDIAKKLKVKLKRGKGWNLWASTQILKTDIIAWVDSDITNFAPRFITGIVGPMLVDKNIAFVKGYYQRPNNDARVTELVVRPFINQIFPELRSFLQPLAGECAGRRKFLTSIDYFSGYSVEMAMLIQAVMSLKPNQIAQSYLGKRTHTLNTISFLSRMSASILRTLLILAEKEGRLKLNARLSKELHTFISDDGENFRKKKFDIADVQLPKIES